MQKKKFLILHYGTEIIQLWIITEKSFYDGNIFPPKPQGLFKTISSNICPDIWGQPAMRVPRKGSRY